MITIEAPFDLIEEQRKHVFSESPVGLEPVFGIASEPLDAVDLGSPLRNTFLFAHLDMHPTQPKT
jgi:hypothetical protein